MKLLIVGGVAGGASAVARARRLSEDAEDLWRPDCCEAIIRRLTWRRF